MAQQSLSSLTEIAALTVCGSWLSNTEHSLLDMPVTLATITGWLHICRCTTVLPHSTVEL